MPDAGLNAEVCDFCNAGCQPLGEAFRIRFKVEQHGTMHQFDHILAMVMFFSVKVSDGCPHIVQNHPFYRNIFRLEFPAFVKQAFLGDLDMHTVPGTPAKKIKEGRITAACPVTGLAVQQMQGRFYTGGHGLGRTGSRCIDKGKAFTTVAAGIPGKHSG